MQTILITGATSGFGLACAELFAAKGWRLIVYGRGEERLRELQATRIRVTNIEPGLADTEFSVVRFHGEQAKADAVYRGTQSLTGADIADIVYWVTAVPPHVNINCLEVMPVCQSWAPFAIHRGQQTEASCAE